MVRSIKHYVSRTKRLVTIKIRERKKVMFNFLKRKKKPIVRNKVYLVRGWHDMELQDGLYEVFYMLIEEPDGTRYYEKLKGCPTEVHDWDNIDFTTTARVVAWSEGGAIPKSICIDLTKMESELEKIVSNNLKKAGK